MKKPGILLFALLAILFIACNKSGEDRRPVDASLQGRWIYTESYASPGNGFVYQPASPANQYIDFKEGGSFSSTVANFAANNRFEIIDSAKFRLFDAQNKISLFGYYFDQEERKLNIYSLDFICIEGCGMIFKRD